MLMCTLQHSIVLSSVADLVLVGDNVYDLYEYSSMTGISSADLIRTAKHVERDADAEPDWDALAESYDKRLDGAQFYDGISEAFDMLHEGDYEQRIKPIADFEDNY